MRGWVLLGGIAAAFSTASPAWAADGAEPDWFVRGGLSQLTLADDIELSVMGNPLPGAGIDTDAHYTPTLHIGRNLGSGFAAVLTVGLPPRIEIDGAGTLEPLGKLAETTYGPMMATIQYRPIRQGPVQPYVGAGAAYMIVFDADDAAFQDVEIDNDLAPALELGTDIMVGERWGFFVEVKKAFLRTEARGSFAGMPVVGDVRLDPWGLTAGVVFRF